MEKHLSQQVRRSKFHIEMTDFISRRTLKQCGGLIFAHGRCFQYGDETARTKSTLTDVMSALNTRKNAVNAKISDLNSQLRAAENELQNIKNQISSTQADLAEWQRIRTNASYDMEYYRRKMLEVM